MRSNQQNTLILPDVFEESILSRKAQIKFRPAYDEVVDLSPKLPLELCDCRGERLAARRSDHEHVDVTCGILLVACKRPVEISLFYFSEFAESTRDQGPCADGFYHDAANFTEE